jgi:hypothetical protein
MGGRRHGQEGEQRRHAGLFGPARASMRALLGVYCDAKLALNLYTMVRGCVHM